MIHDALNCAVLYCVVDQVVLCIRLLAELIWILNSSCLNPWLAQSWPQSQRAGRSTSLSSRSDSVRKRDEPRGAKLQNSYALCRVAYQVAPGIRILTRKQKRPKTPRLGDGQM